MKRQFTVLLCILAFSVPAFADDPECKRTKTTCIDTTPSKIISSVEVKLADVGGCWQYQDSYSCVKDDRKDYCQPLISLACGVTGSVCNGKDFNGDCLDYTNTYLCTNKKLDPIPLNVDLISTKYRIVSEKINDSACLGFETARCARQGVDVCLDNKNPRNINGLNVTRDCWKWERTYSCVDGQLTSTCNELKQNPDCKVVDSSCTAYLPAAQGGKCSMYQYTYICKEGGDGLITSVSCDTQTFCIDGKCFDTGYIGNNEFGKTVTYFELIRQAGLYMDPNSLAFFDGQSKSCEIKLGGLGNCCNVESAGGNYKNSAISATTVKIGTEIVWAYGAPYVYDMLLSSGSDFLVDRAVSMISSNFDMTGVPIAGDFSMYGFSFSFSAEAGLQFMGFDPMTFAISIAIQVVMNWLECSTDENVLAMARGQNLCYFTRQRCTSDFLGACLVVTQDYCCFNSVLAKIIQRQGSAQLKRGFGACNGFSQSELKSIDFSKINFEEFISTLTATIKDGTQATGRVNQRVTEAMKSYYSK